MLLSATAIYLWRNREELAAVDRPIDRLAALSRPVSLFAVGLGLALIG